MAELEQLLNPGEFFRVLKPTDAERAFAVLSRLERHLALLGIKRHKRAGDGKCCIRKWQHENRQELERMRRAHRDGNEFACYDALAFCQDTETPVPEWVMNAIVAEAREPRSKKPGRHLRASVRQADMVRDVLCWWFASWFHDHNEDHSWKRAYMEAAERLGMKPDAVRKACARAEKRKTDHFSETLALAR